MGMTSDTIIRINLEVVLGKPPARDDNEEEAELRSKITANAVVMKAQGLVMSIPFEIPSI